MTSQPLKVLIVAEERRVLRHLSKSLSAFGYAVQGVADWQMALDALDVRPPDVLIVDSQPNAQAALEFCGSVDRRVRPGHVHTFLIVQRSGPRELTEALEAGVDDFLEKPIVYGELLARLRAAARILEFERRVGQQAGVDPLTHLPSRALFGSRLRRALTANRESREPAACVLIDLDALDRINHLHGHPAGDRALKAVAEVLGQVCDPADLVASFGGGRFCALLDKSSEDEAVAWAQRVRQALAEMDFSVGESQVRLTASFGVVGLRPVVQTPEEVLEHAALALGAAKSSGRDCAVRYGEFDGDAEAWADFGAPGKLFDRTLARHIMTPCTVVLPGDATVGEAAEWFHRTRAEALPVVDQYGKLAGLVFASSVLEGPPGIDLASLPILDLVTTDVPVYDETTGFTKMKDFFTHDSRSLIVVVDDDVPTGFVTPNSLAALSSPLTAESFACTGPLTNDSQFLVVPDLCPLSDG